MFFSGYKKLLLTSLEVKGVSSIVKLVLTFRKVKSGKGGVQRSATQKAAKTAAQTKRAAKTTESTNNNPHQQKQTAAQIAPNSSNTCKKHQKDQQKHQKDQQKQQKDQQKQQKDQQKQQQKLHKQYKQQRKQQKQQQRHEGPEGGAPKVSLCFHWRLLVEFRWCFRVFFEIPVKIITIGY